MADSMPADYQFVDWDHLQKYIGRVILGNDVPRMTEHVVDYLKTQARELRRSADRLTLAAEAMTPRPEK